MEPTALKAYLDSLCEQLDSGTQTVRVMRFAGAALVAGGTMTACFEKGENVALYGAVFDTSAPPAEICDDDFDNDGDGHIDCADPDCDDDPACEMVDEYGAPAVEDVCDDDLDNDHDGDIDCADEDCIDDPACMDDALYGTTFE